ncbi:MAG: hypothetical protein IJC71_01855 [Clostridia bacterium]|nr:hypothetical protein [Clostridia bacterium]
MRKMLLGIYLALLAVGALILFLALNSLLFASAAILLVIISAYFIIDGWFLSGPRSREEEHDPKIPPKYR